jgi:hypothetical protein
MEYLMTYGWALLVIVVVGAALFALGVLNPQSYSSKGCRGLTYFTYQDVRLNTTGFVIDVINGKDTVAITGLRVNGVDATVVVPAANQAGSTRFQISGAVATGAAGTSYTYPIDITYNVINGISGNQDRATCTGVIAA